LRIVPLAIWITLWLAPGPQPAFAQGVNRAELRDVMGVMDADPAIRSFYALCLGDQFNRRRGARTSDTPAVATNESACAANPENCWKLCRERRSGSACFGLARVFQDHGEKKVPHSQILFTMACAGGYGAGCTNRAAGVRNGDYRDDPIRAQPKQRREACLLRSFQKACTSGDAWGCAMLGQAYRLGEGAPANAARARANYNRSCSIAPGVSACEHAQDGIKAMGRR
jgi:hypothetical protein